MRGAWRAVLAVVAIAAGAAAAEPALRDWGGKPTPPLELRDVAGRGVDLRKLEGRVVLVNFWATWCEPCIAEMPAIQRLRAKLDGRPFEVLAVNYGESRPKVEAYLRKAGITLHVLLDPDQQAADAWGAKGLPMTFLVDSRGHVRSWVFGQRDWDAGDSLATVEKLVAEVPGARR